MPRKPKTVGSAVSGTPESAAANRTLVRSPTVTMAAERRGIIDKWTEEHESIIIAVLDRMAEIATKGKSDRDAIAAGKVLLDHTQGRPPEAVESKPNQFLTINRYGVDPDAKEPYADEG